VRPPVSMCQKRLQRSLHICDKQWYNEITGKPNGCSLLRVMPLNYLLGGIFIVMKITKIKMQIHICILDILLPCDLQFGTPRLSDNGWEQPPGLIPCIIFISHQSIKGNMKSNMEKIFFMKQVRNMDSEMEPRATHIPCAGKIYTV
jgi:hypothetical protein